MIMWWRGENPKALIDDKAVALVVHAKRLQRPAEKVIVHRAEYNGEQVDGLQLETTDKRGHRGHVVVS